MELNKKENIINKLKNVVKVCTDVSGINEYDDKTSLSVNFKYGYENDIKIIFRKQNDMMVMKASVKPILKEDEDIQIALNDILIADDSFMGSIAGENTCDITKVVNFSKQTDSESETLILHEVSTLLSFMEQNKDKIICGESDGCNNEKSEDKMETVQSNDDEKYETQLADNNNISISLDSKKNEELSDIEDINMLINELKTDEEKISKLQNKLDTISEKKSKRFKVNLSNNENGKQKKKENVSTNNKTTETNDTDEKGNEMLTGIEKVFDERKKQADQRENTLNEFAKRLKKKEEDLNDKQKEAEKEIIKQTINLEAEYKKKNEELEAGYKGKAEELEAEYINKKTELDIVKQQIKDEKEELVFNQQKIDLEFKKLEVERENIQRERNNLEEQKTLLGENYVSDNKIEELNSLIEHLKDENLIIIEEMEEIKNTSEKKDVIIEKLRDRIDLFIAETNNGDETEPFSEELEELKKALEEKNEMYEHLLNEKESIHSDKEKIYEECNKQKDDIKQYLDEIATLKGELSEAKKEIQNIKDEKSSEMIVPDIANKASSITNELKNIDINLEVLPSATSNTILTGQKEDVTYCINVDANIIYCEKKIKQCKKYALDIEEWNQEDIRISYFIDSKSNKMVCKYVYNDVLNAVMDIMAKFRTIV